MGNDPPTRFVVRPRFWPSWMFFTLAMQAPVSVIIVIALAVRFISRQPLFGWDDALGCSVGFAGSAVGSAVVILTTRGYTGAELTAEGVRPFYPTGKRDRVFAWSEVCQVVRWRRWPTGRMLCVFPVGGSTFMLPERPADLQGFREAVERFAGPDHPLTLAIADIADAD